MLKIIYSILSYFYLLLGVVATLDKSVGRVVDALKRKDMLQNTIIVFMADNGAQTEGFLANYGSNYPLRGVNAVLHKYCINETTHATFDFARD